MKSFNLPNDSVALLEAKLNDMQPVRCVYLEKLTLSVQMAENKKLWE
jgi:hypothetical protein